MGSDTAPDGTDKFKYAGYDKSDLTCSKCNKKFIEVPYKGWNASDLAEIFGNELEDRNHHWLTNMPDKLLKAMSDTKVSMEMQAQVMQKFVENMISEWS